MIMRKEVPLTAEVAESGRIDNGKSSGSNADNSTVKKGIRAWKPSEFKVSGKRHSNVDI